ncbi:hypothetical protein Nmel_017879, partial [Mimus melanotis]
IRVSAPQGDRRVENLLGPQEDTWGSQAGHPGHTTCAGTGCWDPSPPVLSGKGCGWHMASPPSPPCIPLSPGALGSIRGGGESWLPVRASGRDEEGFGLPPGTRRLVPCFAPRPGPAGSAGDRARAEGATGRLGQGHAMTQSC